MAHSVRKNNTFIILIIIFLLLRHLVVALRTGFEVWSMLAKNVKTVCSIRV